MPAQMHILFAWYSYSVTPDATNGSVSIPLPRAPKKSRQVTKASNQRKVAKASKKSKDVIDNHEDSEVESGSDDDSENDRSSSDPDIARDGDTDDDDDDDDENNLSSDNDGRPHAATNKRFANEQPFWSDMKASNANEADTHGQLFNVSDEEARFLDFSYILADLSATKNLIIRGHVIEISDDEVPTDIEDSPSAHLGSGNASTLPDAATSNIMGLIWPMYTNLVRGGQRDVAALNVQNWELKLIVRKAMDLVEERIRFENAFPPLVTRTVWNRAALVEACTFVAAMPQTSQVREKYEMFKERMRIDPQYIGEISKTLLDPRISILRGDTKTAAIHNSRAAYSLQDGCGPRVQALLTNSRYIYPPAANHYQGVGFQFQRPFENSAIVGTLRDDLFSGNTIVTKYAHRFQETDNEPDPKKLAPSMIALAATAVFSSLKEWESGHRTPTHFTANLFDSIYRTHMKHLETISALNESGYNVMIRRLFRLAANVEDNQADEFNLTDIQNMSTNVNVRMVSGG
ncbi:hypothetical protein M378DRAFT_181655 [Amanita muscaria Koide BX008]|uniref:DUF6532 domain-containing protein n=1 Tax=Amanita muscaria (strain Koide BX008) TaxID=946122 RepID=A0A0C2STI3_AMAMK|nr:hypothetical protein M378DRAFT_181655 [Amanita muscaria Koide BX008]